MVFFVQMTLVYGGDREVENEKVMRKASALRLRSRGAAWGRQDAGHAADATGRRVFSCPGMGGCPVKGAKKRPATYLHADPSQMNKLSSPSLIHSPGPTGVSPLPLRL